jgi:hypothetical protein
MFSFIPPITKNKQRVVFLGAIAAIATAAAIMSTFILGPDNPVEQTGETVVEYVVKEATGVETDLDFSPQK